MNAVKAVVFPGSIEFATGQVWSLANGDVVRVSAVYHAGLMARVEPIPSKGSDTCSCEVRSWIINQAGIPCRTVGHSVTHLVQNENGFYPSFGDEIPDGLTEDDMVVLSRDGTADDVKAYTANVVPWMGGRKNRKIPFFWWKHMNSQGNTKQDQDTNSDFVSLDDFVKGMSDDSAAAIRALVSKIPGAEGKTITIAKSAISPEGLEQLTRDHKEGKLEQEPTVDPLTRDYMDDKAADEAKAADKAAKAADKAAKAADKAAKAGDPFSWDLVEGLARPVIKGLMSLLGDKDIDVKVDEIMKTARQVTRENIAAGKDEVTATEAKLMEDAFRPILKDLAGMSDEDILEIFDNARKSSGIPPRQAEESAPTPTPTEMATALFHHSEMEEAIRHTWEDVEKNLRPKLVRYLESGNVPLSAALDWAFAEALSEALPKPGVEDDLAGPRVSEHDLTRIASSEERHQVRLALINKLDGAGLTGRELAEALLQAETTLYK